MELLWRKALSGFYFSCNCSEVVRDVIRVGETEWLIERRRIRVDEDGCNWGWIAESLVRSIEYPGAVVLARRYPPYWITTGVSHGHSYTSSHARIPIAQHAPDRPEPFPTLLRAGLFKKQTRLSLVPSWRPSGNIQQRCGARDSSRFCKASTDSEVCDTSMFRCCWQRWRMEVYSTITLGFFSVSN